MQSATSIDTRLVLRIYAWATILLGFIAFGWPNVFPSLLTNYDLPGLPSGRVGLFRVVAAAVGAAGIVATGLSHIESPASRQRALHWFARAHLTFGAMCFMQWFAIFDGVVPRVVAWTPLIAGIVLMFIAVTSAHAPKVAGRFRFLPDEE